LQTLAKTSHKSSGLNTRTNVRLTQTSGNTHSEENFRSRLNSSKRSDPRRGKATGSHAHTDADAPTTFASCTDSSRIRRRICLRYAEHRVRTAPVGVRTSHPPGEMGVLDGRKGGVPRGGRREEPRPLGARARVYRRFDATGSTNLINWYFPSRRIAGIARTRASSGAPHRRGPPRFRVSTPVYTVVVTEEKIRRDPKLTSPSPALPKSDPRRFGCSTAHSKALNFTRTHERWAAPSFVTSSWLDASRLPTPGPP
jgi:hypothetical protein